MGLDISVQRPGKDPLLQCDFLVEIEGIAIAGFMEHSALQDTFGESTYREGNMANYPHKQRGLESYANITLKRGIFRDDYELWNWYRSGVRKTVDIVDLKHGRDGDRRVRVTRMYEVLPVMWKDSEGNAMSEDAAKVHELELSLEMFEVNP